MAVSHREAIAANPDVTVGEYVAANLRGRAAREIDDLDAIRDLRLADVLAACDSKTRKLLTRSEYRKP